MSKSYKEIEDFYRQKHKELKEEYMGALREFLVQAGLDGDVIRIKDGKRGKLSIDVSRDFRKAEEENGR